MTNVKRTFAAITALLSLMLFVACTSIPTAPSAIPPDPTGTTKPSISEYVTTNIYGSVDKGQTLLPLAVPDYTKIRLSIPGFESITASNLRVFEDNREQGFVLYKESEYRKKIDIMIILDVTGSMGNAIEGAKNSIIAFANQLNNSGMDVRIGVLPYDDYAPSSDKKYNPRFLNLTTPEEAKTYVTSLTAYGGGDIPENPYAAVLYAATATAWRPGSQRHMILITDAPAHYKNDGTTYTNLTKADLIPVLVGRFTLHGAFVPTNYDPNATNFTAPGDPRELCQVSGGVIKYTDGAGNVDLSELGIVEYVGSSWIVAFQSDSPSATHTIEVFFESGTVKRYLKLENVSY